MVAVDYSLNISELEIIRQVLSLADEECKKLTLFEVEKIWYGYADFHDRDIPVEKDWMKRFISWIAKDYTTREELRKINKEINKIF